MQERKRSNQVGEFMCCEGKKVVNKQVAKEEPFMWFPGNENGIKENIEVVKEIEELDELDELEPILEENKSLKES